MVVSPFEANSLHENLPALNIIAGSGRGSTSSSSFSEASDAQQDNREWLLLTGVLIAVHHGLGYAHESKRRYCLYHGNQEQVESKNPLQVVVVVLARWM